MADSANIDRALIAKLGADTTLLGYVPNGVYIDEAPPKMTRFVIVSVISALDEGKFGGRAIEDVLYLVEARGLSTQTTLADMNAASARIDALLEDQPLAASGYAWMTMHREERIELTEVDDDDPSIRWYRRGGHYRVQMSLT